MKNLIYKYTIDNHEELNKTLLEFFDTLPNKIGTQEYNLGISKFDGHNHYSSPFLPPEWQYQDVLNTFDESGQELERMPWFKILEQAPWCDYKRIFLDAAENKFREHANFHIQPEITGLDYKFNIMHMWYHQMRTADYIGWDNHQWCQWSAVYFVEVSDQKYITEFLDPETQEVMRPEAKAGDMLIFPSWLLHRAPIIVEDTRKTILAWNMDVCYVFPDDQIKKLKETHPGNWKL
jgi:hypothetical protein